MNIIGSIQTHKALSGKSARGEEGCFRRARVAAKSRIAMREPSETPDDSPVEMRKFQIFRIAKRMHQPNASVLIRQRF